MDRSRWTLASALVASIGCGAEGLKNAPDALVEPQVVDAVVIDTVLDAGPDALVDAGPDALVHAEPDAPVDGAPDDGPVPKPDPPDDLAISGVHAVLAIDDNGIRDTFLRDGRLAPSYIAIEFLRASESVHCNVLLKPRFVKFAFHYVSTRSFKTVVIDPAQSELLENRCAWADTPLLQAIAARGTVDLGWITPRWPESEPYLDTYLGGQWLGGGSWVVNAGGAAFEMDADGIVSNTRVYPQPGTLPRALYGNSSL